MENWMVDLFRNYGDKIITAFFAALTPVGLAIIALYRLKRYGINKYNIMEVTDRAQFRKELMDRVKHVEALYAESQKNEKRLERENGEQAAQITAMEEDIKELKVERRSLKHELRELRRRMHSITQERDQFKARLT